MRKADLDHYRRLGNFFVIRWHAWLRTLKSPGFSLAIATTRYKTVNGWRTSRVFAHKELEAVIRKAQEMRGGNRCSVECFDVGDRTYVDHEQARNAAKSLGIENLYEHWHNYPLEQYLEWNTRHEKAQVG